MAEPSELSRAYYKTLPGESEKERLQRLLTFATECARGEQGGFWPLERDRIQRLLDKVDRNHD